MIRSGDSGHISLITLAILVLNIPTLKTWTCNSDIQLNTSASLLYYVVWTKISLNWEGVYYNLIYIYSKLRIHRL